MVVNVLPLSFNPSISNVILRKLVKMNKFIKSLLLLLLAVNTSRAQNYQWEIGTLLGLSMYQGDLTHTTYYDLKEANPAFGIFFRNNLHPNINLRANVFRGKLSGSDLNDRRNTSRGFSFSSPITEASIQLEFDLFGQKRYRDYTFKKIFSPYFFAGLGFGIVKQTVSYNEEQNEDILDNINRDKTSNFNQPKFSTPLGAGLKFDLTQNWTIGGELGWRPSYTDVLDGVSNSGNPRSKDSYIFGGLTLSYRMGEVDSDGDGLVDSKDKCPNEKGFRTAKGCPDIDQDGIKDNNDDCPYDKGYASLNGCPDRDKDGVTDKDDVCPNEPGFREFKGCPIKDTDGDGVEDVKDNCPYEVGLPERQGCPFRDTDKDGLEDYVDECPEEIGFLFNNGCPDRDNDGVVDKEDVCPDFSGTKANGGCPEITEWESDLLKSASRRVQFENEAAKINEKSYMILNEIVNIMQKYMQYNLRIEGYTDDQGNDFVNQQLSLQRAKACFDYIVSHGVSPTRVNYLGLGENNPVASNNSIKGREANRRVEFILVLP